MENMKENGQLKDQLTKKPSWIHKRNWVEDGSQVAITTPPGRMYWLNESGGFIWKMCDGKHTIGDLTDAMVERYENLDRNTAIKDLIELILSWERLGLVTLR
jgi:methyltransferase-like protein